MSAIIPCQQNIDLDKKINEFVEVLKTATGLTAIMIERVCGHEAREEIKRGHRGYDDAWADAEEGDR
jgi:heterodisulfide reductase subunit A-like polyferredoxin